MTVESFMNWKKSFDEEMLLLKAKVKEVDSKKLTGKELFMTDKTLNESDLKFLEEGKNYCLLINAPDGSYCASCFKGDDFKVDETLFEDIDELDLDEDDDS